METKYTKKNSKKQNIEIVGNNRYWKNKDIGEKNRYSWKNIYSGKIVVKRDT